MSPKTFDGVGGDTVLRIFLFAVVDDAVLVSFTRQTCIRTELVRKDMSIVSNELFDDGQKRSSLGVLYDKSTGFAFSCHHTEDGSLSLGGTSLRSFCFLGFVLIGFTSTKVHFVHFHLTVKDGSIVLCKQSTNFMENIPCSLLRDVDVTSKLMGGNPLLMATDKIHSHKPFLQGQFGIFEDGAYKTGESLVTIGTLELIITVATCVNMHGAAVRADNHLTPTLLGNEVTATFVAIEMAD